MERLSDVTTWDRVPLGTPFPVDSKLDLSEVVAVLPGDKGGSRLWLRGGLKLLVREKPKKILEKMAAAVDEGERIEELKQKLRDEVAKSETMAREISNAKVALDSNGYGSALKLDHCIKSLARHRHDADAKVAELNTALEVAGEARMADKEIIKAQSEEIDGLGHKLRSAEARIKSLTDALNDKLAKERDE